MSVPPSAINDAFTPPTRIIGTQVPSIKYTDRRAIRLLLMETKVVAAAAKSITNTERIDIALIHVSKGNSYELPDGGIGDHENHCVATVREAMEGTGCQVNILGETRPATYLAMTEGWRCNLRQTSFAYVAVVEKDTRKVGLTEEERAE